MVKNPTRYPPLGKGHRAMEPKEFPPLRPRRKKRDPKRGKENNKVQVNTKAQIGHIDH